MIAINKANMIIYFYFYQNYNFLVLYPSVDYCKIGERNHVISGVVIK
jgi:hypothetical protein